MQTFKNKNFIQRRPDVVNVVACVGHKAPNANYIPAEPEIIDGLDCLWAEGLGDTMVRYYGYL